MKAKTLNVTIALEGKLMDALKRIAATEKRSVSNLVGIVMAQWVDDHRSVVTNYIAKEGKR